MDDEIKKAGLRATSPRIHILRLFSTVKNKPASRHGHHMSAEDVYKTLLQEGEEISLATVYRVLNQFVTAGLLNKHHFESGMAIYELAHGEHHDHLVCTRCNRIIEFVDPIIEQRQHNLATENGFNMTDHSLIIYGICAQCHRA